jgi:hypothetical protein
VTEGPNALEMITGYVIHARDQIPVHKATAEAAKGYATDTAAWAAEQGIGKQHGLFYNSAVSAAARAEAAIKALDVAQLALNELQRALIEMGA